MCALPQCASRPNEVWTYDLLEVRTERGGKLRMLTILDEYTRECLTMHVACSISSCQIIQVLEWLSLLKDARVYLRSDNGSDCDTSYPVRHFSSYCKRDRITS